MPDGTAWQDQCFLNQADMSLFVTDNPEKLRDFAFNSNLTIKVTTAQFVTSSDARFALLAAVQHSWASWRIGSLSTIGQLNKVFTVIPNKLNTHFSR